MKKEQVLEEYPDIPQDADFGIFLFFMGRPFVFTMSDSRERVQGP